jgi:putative transposase
LVYHALNRGNARLLIFEDDEDYAAFERTLGEAVTRHGMRLLAYRLMPNHFHLVVWPRLDGELTRFMRWLTMTHTQRWHARRHSAGSGHLYQGRFKSFPVQDDGHLLTVCRYVERNALRAGLVERAQLWRWGSLWRRTARKPPEGPALSPWPTERPSDWTRRVNAALNPVEEEALGRAIKRGQPFGDPGWQVETAQRLDLVSTLRPIGRPRNPTREDDHRENGS